LAKPTPAESVSALFDQYGREIFAHVRLMVGSTEDAEDLVQDIFLRALRGWASFEHRASARTWLWAITRHVLQDHFRQQAREQAKRDQLAIRAAASPITWNATRVLLDEVLAALSLPQRDVFVLRVVEDYSSKETAALLGWTEVRVRVTLYRALKRLQAWRNEGVSEPHG
jgi:RNA polymerase sigma-70 factor (ECF subfamily)